MLRNLNTDRYTLLYAHYDEETGVSKVRIQTPYGVFKGKAKLHPDDINYDSRYAGCELAELRAVIKAYKFKKKIYTAVYDELCKLGNCKKVAKEKEQITQIIDNLTIDINELTSDIEGKIKARNHIIERIKKGGIGQNTENN